MSHLLVAASTLEFDDNEKQKLYKTISFSEVHNEIIELKVSSPIIVYLVFLVAGYLSMSFDSIQMIINWHNNDLRKANAKVFSKMICC